MSVSSHFGIAAGLLASLLVQCSSGGGADEIGGGKTCAKNTMSSQAEEGRNLVFKKVTGWRT